jgi:hypothetical protein
VCWAGYASAVTVLGCVSGAITCKKLSFDLSGLYMLHYAVSLCSCWLLCLPGAPCETMEIFSGCRGRPTLPLMALSTGAACAGASPCACLHKIC